MGNNFQHYTTGREDVLHNYTPGRGKEDDVNNSSNQFKTHSVQERSIKIHRFNQE